MPKSTKNPPRPNVMEAGRDVLQNPDAPLPVNETKAVRAAERLTPDGKAVAQAERGEMYDNPVDSAGESGTQAGSAGEETADQTPLARRT